MGERWDRVLDGVRAWLGPDRATVSALAQAEADLGAERAAHAREAQQWVATRSQWDRDRRVLVERERKAQHYLTLAFEPPQGAECSKIRLRDREEAAIFVRRMASEVGRPVEAFRVYACDLCLRQPVTGNRFLHIANRDPALRTNRGGLRDHGPALGEARRAGRTIGQRVDRPDAGQREVGRG